MECICIIKFFIKDSKIMRGFRFIFRGWGGFERYLSLLGNLRYGLRDIRVCKGGRGLFLVFLLCKLRNLNFFGFDFSFKDLFYEDLL